MQVHTFPAFPTEYPPSALLGCVRVTDCLSNEEYVAHYPDGEDNDSAYLFLCARPRSLLLPIRVSGQHKIWTLDAAVHQAARASLRPAGATWDARPASGPRRFGSRAPPRSGSSPRA